MKLDAQSVHETLIKCLAEHGELTSSEEKAAREGNPPPGWHIIESVILRALVNDAKVKKQTGVIRELLDQLPEQFHQSKGGGWSFLQACMTQDGRQWGEHSDIDALICLGVAAGLVRIQFPRSMWKNLPGGMPYFVVLEQQKGS